MFKSTLAPLDVLFACIHEIVHGLYLWSTNTSKDIPLKVFLTLCIAYLAGHYNAITLAFSRLKKEELPDSVRPELPPLTTLPSAQDPSVQHASRQLDARIKKLYAGGLVESITVVVATADGPIFSNGYGVRNPKESDPEKREDVDENTIYRISSLTKLFTTIKLWMLKEKGVIAWYAL